MIKKAMLIFIFLSFAAPFSNAQDKFSVSGEVVYSGTESIYVCLHTQETFENCLTALPPEKFFQGIKATSSGRATFKLVDIPKGDYVLMVFIDKNNNGKFDCDAWGRPIEPLLMHKKFRPVGVVLHLNWEDQRFKVNKDVTGIEIEF
jgi:uncharacterized protein (DUF2141 family)